jgi:hypothetical protein
MRTIILSENRKKDLNKLLAEWAGFELVVSSYPGSKFTIEYWCLKDQREKGSFVFDFPNSLNNCYEWLVPKMKSCSITSLKEENHTVKIVLEDGTKNELSSDSAPMSLCLALEQLIVAK